MISIDRQNIIDVMESINFIEVIPPLQFNYEKELSFWLDKDRFILFRSNFNVDNYIAIDIQKGKDQFLPFAKCRENMSGNYIESRKYPYYLTLKQIKKIVEVMQIVK